MKHFLVLIGLFIVSFCFGQSLNEYEAIDKKMDAISSNSGTATTYISNYISKNFTTPDEKIRAAFYWIADNIRYDVESLNDPKKPYQTPQEKVSATLKSKKGVCMHYAEVFKDITTKLGIETILISGYTKTKGKIATLSHVWCASKLNETWYLFDPTWGAGYVDNDKFTKKLNNKYYKVEPKNLLSSHMPFDYLWQFSEYPITNQEFYDSKEEAADKSVKFDFMDEVAAYQKLSESDQAKASAERIEKNGIKNTLISGRLDYEKSRITYQKSKDNFAKIQTIIDDFKKANELFSAFIKYRNSKFIPLVSDEKLKSKIQVPYDLMVKCQNNLEEVNDVQGENKGNYNSLKTSIADAKKIFENQLNFVNDYLAKDKAEREKMFFKTTIRKQ